MRDMRANVGFMRKPKTRRSVSIRGLTYQRLQSYCADQGTSISGYMETLIGAALDREGVARPTVLAPRKSTDHRPEVPYQGNHFTF